MKAQNSEVDELVGKAKYAEDGGDIESAIKWLKQAYKLDKNSNQVNYLLAQAYFDNHDYENATIHSSKVVDNGGEFEQECCIIAGNCWDQQLRYHRAEKIYKEGMEKFPDNMLIAYNLANSYFKAKDLEMAEREIAKVILKDPGYAAAHVLLAYISYENGDRIKAMLPLYYYLLINQDDERAEGVYEFLNTLWEQGIRAKGQREAKVHKSGVEVDSFAKMEQELAQLEQEDRNSKAILDTKENLNIHKLSYRTKDLFTVLSEDSSVDYEMWWKFYVNLYSKVQENNYVESFCNFIASCKYEQDVLYWLSLNHSEFKEFTEWMEIEMHLNE